MHSFMGQTLLRKYRAGFAYHFSRLFPIVKALLSEMKQTDEEIEKTEGEFVSLLKELTSSDADIMASLNEFIQMIEG